MTLVSHFCTSCSNCYTVCIFVVVCCLYVFMGKKDRHNERHVGFFGDCEEREALMEKVEGIDVNVCVWGGVIFVLNF